MKNLIGISSPIPDVPLIPEATAQLSKRTTDFALSLAPYVQPASEDDLLARKAAAEVEREDGFDRCAQHRLHGSYDGDAEHRIALAAIRLAREASNPRAESANKGRGGSNVAPARR